MNERPGQVIQAAIVLLLGWVGMTLVELTTVTSILVDKVDGHTTAIDKLDESNKEMGAENAEHITRPHDGVEALIQLAKMELRLEFSDQLEILRDELIK